MTGETSADWSPSFSRDGRYLYFLSARTFSPRMGELDQNHVFLDMTRPYLVLLRKDEPSPFGPMKDAKPETPKAEGEEEAKDAPPRTIVDFEGLERRVVAVAGVPAGRYFRLEAVGDGFLYLKKSGHDFLKYEAVGDTTAGRYDLHHYTLAAESANKTLSGIGNYHLTPDAKTLAYRAGQTFGLVPATKKAKVGDGKLALGDVRIKVDRLAEFQQIFDEAWRVQRDWFYDPGMHGVDWDKIKAKYGRLVPFCGNRADLNYLIGEMIGELNAGHTYIFGGEFGRGGARIPVGLLGVDFGVKPGDAFPHFARIVPGLPGDEAARSPLEEPGCGVAEGDYLVAIDGEEASAQANPLALLENKAGRVVELSYNSEPNRDGAKSCKVTTLRSERGLRYRAWVEKNRAYVTEASGGKLGYLHIPDMMDSGLVEFAKGWYSQYYKDGFVIDERYNGGGFVGDMIIDRLEREIWSLTQPREGRAIPNPERDFHGHLAVLINADTGSNGEYFAKAIKLKGLATVIGKRTWGGAVGIEPHQPLVDGAVTTPPQFAPYGLDGTWLIEGHGVEPDLEVENTPASVLAGKDAQLDAAIRLLLERIAAEPMTIPARPDYPVKAKAGEGR